MIDFFSAYLALPSVAFTASIISGITGLGGGALLMAFMSQTIDPKVLIPLHGLVQLSSNTGRVYFGFKHVHWSIIRQFLIGAIFGGVAGALLPFQVESKFITIMIGLFLITTSWLPIDRLIKKLRGPYWVLGGLSTFLSLFVGVSGPLVHPILVKEKSLDKHSFIATEAFCAGFTHIAKLAVYLYWGFSIYGYKIVLVTMILATILGSFIGSKILYRVSDRGFRFSIKLIVTLLGFKMIIDGLNT